jgi:hypothetical protein
MEYVRSFDSKWLQRGVSPAESLLGSPDIQSLADMVNSFSAVRQMMIVLLDRKNLLTFLVAAAIPFLPLLLLVLPAEELIKGVWFGRWCFDPSWSGRDRSKVFGEEYRRR